MKWIEGYEGEYKISEDGTVTGFKQGYPKVLKSWKCSAYTRVTLYKGGSRKNLLVHRLLAIAFIPNPDNKAIVNHIDGNKLNNHVSNLEWCTAKENVNHAFSAGLVKTKPTLQFSLSGEFIKEYPSAEEACRELGLGYNALSAACRLGINSTAFGYKWKYKEVAI